MLDKKRSSSFRYLYSEGIFDLPLRLWLVFKTELLLINYSGNNNDKLYSQLSETIYRWILKKSKSCFMYKNVYYNSEELTWLKQNKSSLVKFSTWKATI